MKRVSGTALLVAAVIAVVLWPLVPSVAEMADVYLRNGMKLRGDVTATDEEVIVRNSAGELRLARDEVERIVPLTTAESQPSSQPTTRGESPRSRPTTSGPTTQEVLPKEPEKTERPELSPAPPLSDADIERLKMLELKLDGPAEVVRVHFKKKGRQRDLPLEVLDQARKRPEFHTAWEDVLLRGQSYEKLQLIVRLTGTRYADRIDIENDPDVFETFRRRVLPLVERGCARAGCHAGRSARVFRFPMGATTGTTYAYTTFVLLDQMRTKDGALLERANPEASVLLSYLLPQENNPKAHPPVGHGPAFKAVIIHRDDRTYAAVVAWINKLMVPHPEYGLEYDNPYAGLMPPAEKTNPPPEEKKEAPELPESQPAAPETQPGEGPPGGNAPSDAR